MAKRQTLRLLCAEEDRQSLQPILDALRTRGIGVSEDPNGKGTLLAALSEHLYADENLKKALLEAVSSGAESVLPLRLDKTVQPPEIKTALYARNIIPADERSPEQTAGRIAAALPEKKRPTGRLLIAGAVVLALLAALLIWRAIPREQPEPAVPASAEENLIPEGWGLSEADLAYIRSVVIIGDEYHFINSVTPQPGDPVSSVFDYAVDNPDGDGWFSKDDGHEYRLTRYDDLRFLALMPRLECLSFALADIPELPDLSGTQLKYVEFFDCTIDRLDWFDAEKLQSASIDGCPLTDVSPLSATTQQLDAHIGFGEGTSPDLSGFHPKKLGRLELSGSPREIRMPDLSLCQSINELRLRNLPIENLDFLQGGKVYRMTLDGCSRLRDVSGLAGQADLHELELQGCRSLRDYSPIGRCTALQRLLIDTWEGSGVYDASFLEGLSKLQDIQLHGCTLPDLNFLRQYAGRPAGLSFGFRGSCADLSALGAVTNYKFLHLNLNEQGFAEAAALLADVRIDELELHHMGTVDLSAIPPKTMHLQLESCAVGSDLSAMPEINLTQLELRNMPTLRSLEGLQNLARFGENGTGVLRLFNCPRITDFGALDGMMLDSLELGGVYALPDFGSLTFHSLKLDSLDWVEDLKFLDPLDQSYQGYQKFSLPGMEQLRDLSPIARVIRNGNLEVPPQLEEQARDLQNQGKIQWYSVVFPEGGWELDDSELSLLSLDELDTLPEALLRRVTTLAVAGDTVYDPEDYDVWTFWEDNQDRHYLVERRTGERTPIRMGSIEDLSAFAPLTGLRRLTLVSQPLDSLEGIEGMEQLETLDLKNCPELRDLSPAFALQNLHMVFADHMPVESIQGVQNLYRLRKLGLNYTQVSDITPLADCDLDEAMRQGGLELELDNIPCRDLSALAAVQRYRILNVNNLDCGFWQETVRDCEIEQLDCVNAHLDNEGLAELVRQHPELRILSLSWTEELTDLTPVLELDSLEYLRLSRNMSAAIESLQGKDLPFELEIEG